jgi:methyl acetate hydrolase
MEAKLDSVFQQATADNAFPGIAATVVDSKGNRLFHKAFGVNDIKDSNSAKFDTTTPLMLWSCTKLITSLAALQLIEQGKIQLDDAASKYVPEISNIPVFDGKDSDGKLKTRNAKGEITIRHLFTHTSGFTYDFFDVDTLGWRIQNGQTPCAYLANDEPYMYTTPLRFDPGTGFNYGISIDWLGFVVEAVSGLKLQDYFAKNILTPLGMNNSFNTFPEGRDRLLVHTRGESGTEPLASNAEMAPPPGLRTYGGGHFMISTLDDYSTLLSTILNGGTSPSTGASILKPETIDTYLFQDQMPATADRSDLLRVPINPVPMLSNTGSLLPNTKLGWSCGLMINNEDVPGGRKKGSGMWAGMGNLYYWIDPSSDLAGMVITSVLPFFDAGVLDLFEKVERVAYGGEPEQAGSGKAFFTVPL